MSIPQLVDLANVDLSATSYDTLFLRAFLKGGICIGHEYIDVTDAAVKTLTKPADAEGNNASYALLVLEGDSTSADLSKCVRWTMEGTDPTAADGMPLGDNGVFEIQNETNLDAFKVIGIEAGKTHKLRVAYYV
jgi:hypothetical protein